MIGEKNVYVETSYTSNETFKYYLKQRKFVLS